MAHGIANETLHSASQTPRKQRKLDNEQPDSHVVHTDSCDHVKAPSQTCHKQHVVLLKAGDPKYSEAFLSTPPSQEQEEQQQEQEEQEQVHEALYQVHFVDVLQFEFLNHQLLAQALQQVDTAFCGVLLTSPRAAQAIAQQLECQPPMQRAKWIEKLQQTRVFAVGNATSRELAAWGIQCEGQETGSAEQMAVYLEAKQGELDAAATPNNKPMLFVCGEKHHSALPSSFEKRNKPLQKLMVYRSCAVQQVQFPDFGDSREPDWIVFFSPSGLHAVQAMDLQWKSIKKAAIGKTTSAAMQSLATSQEKPEWNADVVAPKPTPEALARAIREFDRKKSSRNGS